jgi:Domain of unknown function (DUF4124)
MRIMRLTAQVALLACGTLIAAATIAQTNSGHETFYRCKDVKGQVHFGSSMPEECQGRDTDVVNNHGTVLRVIEGANTHEARVEREASEAEQQRLKTEQLQRDKVLIETYLSVDEIERLREQRLDLLTAQLTVAEQHIATLRDRLVRLREQSARFKPYNEKPNAPPLPDHIAEDLIGTVKSIAVDEQTIQIKRDEQATLTTNFERDIKRFKELKGIK